MQPVSHPNVKLNGIEYLLISIQSNPGKSQRWHLRRKYMYQHGRPDYHKGGSGCGYFRSPSYRNVLWHDRSHWNGGTRVRYGCSRSVNSTFWNSGPLFGRYPSYAYKSYSAQMYLTQAGWSRANDAREKLGLEPLPFDENY